MARAKDCYNCPYVNGCIERATMTRKEKEKLKQKAILDRVKEWTEKNLPQVILPSGPAHRAEITIADNGDNVILNKEFFSETFAKNKRNKKLSKTMRIAMKIMEWLPNAQFVTVETGIHHPWDFNVYTAHVLEETVEIKARVSTSGIYLYNMQIKK